MRRTSRVHGLVCAGLAGVVAIGAAGCAGEGRRGSEGTRSGEIAGAGSVAPAAGWTRVTVKRVDLKPDRGSYVLEALASVPSPGWKVEIRPLPVTTPTAREFEVVGLAPATAAAGAPTLVAASLVLSLDEDVEQVAVHDEDDATLLSTGG